MSRNVKELHPKLQVKIAQLVKLCEAEGIHILFSECVRTVAEQDALYAKGRTKPGNIVTNAKGTTYSSMHQWGIAVDFYLNMDVDGDGSKSDDAFNNATKLFNRVGVIGQSIGLEWGGSWKSIKDLPHFQLPDWGSTASTLKKQFVSPDVFMRTWSIAEPPKVNQDAVEAKKTPVSKSNPVPAKSMSSVFKKTFVTKANLNMRLSPVNGSIVLTIPKGSKVQCYGYYTHVDKYVWLFVAYGKYTGYVRIDYVE